MGAGSPVQCVNHLLLIYDDLSGIFNIPIQDRDGCANGYGYDYLYDFHIVWIVTFEVNPRLIFRHHTYA
jgi:hypothetical protein